MRCDRCDVEMKQFFYSWFNADVICKKCRTLEEADKEYSACRQAEHEAILRGDFNFNFDENFSKRKKRRKND